MKSEIVIIGAGVQGATISAELAKYEVSAIFIDDLTEARQYELSPQLPEIVYTIPIINHSKYFAPVVNNRASRRKAKRKK
jgi:hypothetical protein